MLAKEHKQVYKFTKMLFLTDGSDVIMILGPPGNGKSQQFTLLKKLLAIFYMVLCFALEQL